MFLHSQEMIYCDLKPENIAIDENGQRLVLIDFGLVLLVSDAEKNAGQRCQGNLAYTAPEVLREKKNSLAGDSWSLGYLCALLVARTSPAQMIFISRHHDLCRGKPRADALINTKEDLFRCMENARQYCLKNISLNQRLLAPENHVSEINDDVRKRTELTLKKMIAIEKLLLFCLSCMNPDPLQRSQEHQWVDLLFPADAAESSEGL